MLCAEERYKKILDLLNEREYISTNELIELIDTSRETVRRDLNTLSERGALIKTHGGAASRESATALYDTPVILREATNVTYKREICESAARYIEDKDNIFVDNSSTAANLISFIPKNYHITLITYSIKLLLELAKLKTVNWNIISLGGTFDFNTLSTNNFLTMTNLSIFKPTKTFVSCHGIDEHFSVTDSYLNDVEIKRTALASSQETFLLADHSKLLRKGVMHVTDAKAFNHIITNQNADTAFVNQLMQYGCNVELIPHSGKK